MNIEELRAIANCWIDQAIIDHFDDDLETLSGPRDDYHESDIEDAILSMKAYAFVKDLEAAINCGAAQTTPWSTFE